MSAFFPGKIPLDLVCNNFGVITFNFRMFLTKKNAGNPLLRDYLQFLQLLPLESTTPGPLGSRWMPAGHCLLAWT